MKSKYLFSFTEEGVQFRVQIRTKNNWKTFSIWNGSVAMKGFRGTYKNRTVRYRDYCPENLVRHHERYNDKDVNEGIVLVTRGEHAKIHKHGLTGQFMSHKKRRY
jgi:hypothetical protein